jgi:outer membrane protein
MKKMFLISFISLLSFSIFAQKTAFIHRDSILLSMPEMQNAQKVLNEYYTSAQNEIQTMQSDYQKKVEAYNNNQLSYSDAVKSNKVQEIKDLEKRIQDFQVQAQTEFNEKQNTLLKPIQKKFDEAVEKVRKKLSYDVISNINQDILFVNPKFIITGDVMTELGIK